MKKWIYLIMLAILILPSILVACNPEEPEVEPTEPPAAEETAAEETAAEETAAEETAAEETTAEEPKAEEPVAEGDWPYENVDPSGVTDCQRSPPLSVKYNPVG